MNTHYNKNIVYCLFLLLSVFAACSTEKPVCPQLPYYTGATRISEKQDEATRRIATYETNDKPDKVLAYYKDALLANSWQKKSESQQGITFSYITQSDKPPFDISVLVTDSKGGKTVFDVYLTIAGPFAGFDKWCSSLKP